MTPDPRGLIIIDRGTIWEKGMALTPLPAHMPVL